MKQVALRSMLLVDGTSIEEGELVDVVKDIEVKTENGIEWRLIVKRNGRWFQVNPREDLL